MRTVRNAWFAGEEHRSVGANWFLQNPPVPSDSVVLLVNRRSDRQKLRIASNRAALRELARSVASGEVGYPLELVASDADSDVVPFDKRGKTFLAFMENNPDHHAATDGVERIDFNYLEHVNRTAFVASWLAANDVMP